MKETATDCCRFRQMLNKAKMREITSQENSERDDSLANVESLNSV